ncbi:MAG: sugar phosphate isomerase/epimerase family protein [Bacteroidota bacterium]
MKNQHRRTFLKQASVLPLAATLPTSFLNLKAKKRRFKMCLNPGIIGVSANQLELLEYADRFGFEAITVNLDEMVKMDKAERTAFVDQMKEKGLSWGSTNLPIEFRKDEATFNQHLAELPAKAAALQAVGGTRVNTWIMPTHDTLTYLENFQQHQKRLKATANILGYYDIRLGLEYVGPKTLMTRDKFAFVRTMKEGKELIAGIDEPNVGFVLDSFHWFCAGETMADVLTLEQKDIVTVDLNDARKNFTADEQIDGKRELPMATDVIDMKSFLQALVAIGYDGPVRAEPFNQVVNDMGNEAAIKATKIAMDKAFALV